MNVAWMDDALCAQVGAEPFFVDVRRSSRPARRVCARCTVRDDCLHGKGSFTTVRLHPDRLDKPLHWRKPRRIFVNSMSDPVSRGRARRVHRAGVRGHV